jgi:hypothetical protein
MAWNLSNPKERKEEEQLQSLCDLRALRGWKKWDLSNRKGRKERKEGKLFQNFATFALFAVEKSGLYLACESDRMTCAKYSRSQLRPEFCHPERRPQPKRRVAAPIDAEMLRFAQHDNSERMYGSLR